MRLFRKSGSDARFAAFVDVPIPLGRGYMGDGGLACGGMIIIPGKSGVQ